MKPRHVYLIRKSFSIIESHGSIAALIFYRHLFELAPALRPMFRSDIELQARKFTAMLQALIGMLDQPEQLMAELEAMGAAHAGYGVEDAHYAVAREALTAMVAEVLGSEFTPETAEAWKALYDTVQRCMKLGAGGAVPN